MKQTTTLYDYVQSELNKAGHNEFLHNNQIVSRNKDYAFMRKYIKCDDDVYKIVNEELFIDFSLTNEESDRLFKRSFINRFIDAEFKKETVDVLISNLIYNCLVHETYLNNVYDDINKYIKNDSLNYSEGEGSNKNKSNSHSNNVNNNRSINNDLPSRENINISLNDDTFKSATTNSASKSNTLSDNNSSSDSENTNKNKSLSMNYNIDNLIKSKTLLNDFFKLLDKELFLQTW